MAERTDTNDFDILLFLVQRIILLLVSTGICARIKYGEITFGFKIQDGKVTHSEPNIKLSVKPEPNK